MLESLGTIGERVLNMVLKLHSGKTEYLVVSPTSNDSTIPSLVLQSNVLALSHTLAQRSLTKWTIHWKYTHIIAMGKQ